MVEFAGQTLEHDEVEVRIFVRAPYDKEISQETRFWRLSGVEFGLDADGVSFRVESLAALLAAEIEDAEEKTSPNVVKVVVDNADNAIYFSRAMIPYPRDASRISEARAAALHHHGIRPCGPMHYMFLDSYYLFMPS